MKTEVRGISVELEPNSRPYLVKRFVADGLDIILIFGLYLLFTFLILKTPLADTYYGHADRAEAIVKEAVARYDNDAKAITSALNGNEEYRNERLAVELHGYLLKGLAVFLAEAILLLAVPLLSHWRVTPGKMLTGIMPFNEKKQTRAVWYQILYRFLFVFLIDSMALYLLTGTLTFLLVPVIRLTEILMNKKNKTVCDAVTGILIIEKASYDGIN
ncbi:MAG: RDD family protein [Lachnospiraceae bacterium]|nr:RDD family protein [Lachnospiraceae bacterium]